MRKPLVLLFAIGCLVVLNVGAGIGGAQAPKADQETLVAALKHLDTSILALRRGESVEPSLRAAESEYDKLGIENIDNALHTKIKNSFEALRNSPREENLRALRADIVLAASKIGLEVPFHLEHAMFVILAVSACLAFLFFYICYLGYRCVVSL